jgi:2-keto-4-pentenoate hydratase/2-oxohepta-3-ene-1,7-dioic acid hydratase in catechol pathway
MTMRSAIYTLILAVGILASPRELPAQTSEPFKLGTFEHQGERFVGAVIGSTVIELVAANQQLQRQLGWVKLPMAGKMKELIGRYEYGLKHRVYQIVNAVNSADERPNYVHDLGALKVLPPIMYPGLILNTAVNYRAHAEEMAGRSANIPTGDDPDAPKSMPGLWERKSGDTRHNPYFFIKPSRAVIADGEAIRMPPKREKLDWECELAIVIGRPASHVSIDDANDYIFGYTIEMDVSDRGGRGDGRHGSDWLIGKGHDTFAPLGPFIVPKEFVKDPMNLALKFTLNDQVMQDSNTSYMWHNVYELTHFASNIVTLQPGDVVSTGSASGVGAGRTPPIFMKKGDTAVSWIDGIGTLTNPIK